MSLTTPLVLAFGAVLGAKASVLLHLLLGLEGLRRLVRRGTGSPLAIAFTAVVGFANASALGRATASGHHGAVVLAFYPWVLLALLDLKEGRRAALRLGLWLSLALHTSLHYFAIYLLLLLPVLLLLEAAASRGRAGAVLARGALGAILGLLLAAPRLLPSVLYVLDFPRAIEPVGYRPAQLLEALLDPRRDLAEPAGNLLEGGKAFAYDWAELSAYVGAVPLLAALLATLARPTRWAGLALLGFGLSLGPHAPPGALLGGLPVVSGLYFATRWMAPALLFLGLAGASGLPRLAERIPGRGLRAGAGLLLAACLGHGAYVAARRGAEACPLDPARLAGLSRSDGPAGFVNVAAQPALGDGLLLPLREAVRLDLGIIAGYEPMLGYDRGRRNATRDADRPDYRGEVWLVRPGGEEERISAENVEWTPNRIRVRGVPLDGTRVRTNFNLGSGWTANGEPVLPEAPAVDLLARPAIAPDASGAVDLGVRPDRWKAGLLLLVAGAGLAAAIRYFGAW